MQVEVEAKFLNISHDDLRMRLEKLGATRQNTSRLMRRVNMDYPDRQLQKQQNGWLRIRDEGNRTTLAYKQLEERTVNGTVEAEVVVSDFKTACSIFEAIGLEPKSYQESRRETWELDGVDVVLDEWPHVRPFCEVEGADDTAVAAVAAKIGLDWRDAIFGSVEPVYQAEYDITDEEFYDLGELRFDAPVPAELAARRRP